MLKALLEAVSATQKDAHEMYDTVCQLYTVLDMPIPPMQDSSSADRPIGALWQFTASLYETRSLNRWNRAALAELTSTLNGNEPSSKRASDYSNVDEAVDARAILGTRL